jgi:putative ABC transport system permease protein
MRALLVVTEVALSVVLLVSAGLTVRNFVALQQVNLGFRPERVMTVGLPLPPKRYTTWDERNRFARELLERVKTLPGVQAATIGNGGLPFDGPSSNFTIEGHADGQSRRIMIHLVGAGYLDTLRIPLRHGRMLTEREVDTGDHVALINEAAARTWPAGVDPLGRRVSLELLRNPGSPSVLAPPDPSPLVTIIGVIADTRNDDLRAEPQPAVILPYTLLAPPQRTLAVRTDRDPKTLTSAIRAQVNEMDAQQPITGPTSFEQMLEEQTAQPRFTMALFSLFAALGLALAMAGIYSVLSYLVSRRTREIGVRMALGAQRADVLALVLRTGGKLVGAGVVIGVLASLGAARLLRSQLEMFQASSADPLTFLGILALLGVVAVAACFVPARRATKVDPMVALRYE